MIGISSAFITSLYPCVVEFWKSRHSLSVLSARLFQVVRQKVRTVNVSTPHPLLPRQHTTNPTLIRLPFLLMELAKVFIIFTQQTSLQKSPEVHQHGALSSTWSLTSSWNHQEPYDCIFSITSGIACMDLRTSHPVEMMTGRVHPNITPRCYKANDIGPFRFRNLCTCALIVDARAKLRWTLFSPSMLSPPRVRAPFPWIYVASITWNARVRSYFWQVPRRQ